MNNMMGRITIDIRDDGKTYVSWHAYDGYGNAYGYVNHYELADAIADAKQQVYDCTEGRRGVQSKQ